MINRSQCTIYWYVDDTKISHNDSRVVDKIIESIENSFGKMIVTGGKAHMFVGMEITFMEDETAEIIRNSTLRNI